MARGTRVAWMAGLIALVGLPAGSPAQGDRPDRQWTERFMKRLVDTAEQYHLKKDPQSAQVGMLYEYYVVPEKRWIQGEALDTMHDGAWFASALVHASRATGDRRYREFLTRYSLPFYTRMLNQSDTLFADLTDHSDGKVKWDREHRIEPGERGWVPYWWDDGASFSLEANRKRTGRAAYPAFDRLAGKENPEGRLDGYCTGTSNHMAQDLGVMLENAWLLTRDPQVALAARNLHECRMRHHGVIPAVAIAHAVANDDAALLERLSGPATFEPAGTYFNALAQNRKTVLPGFMDGTEYDYFVALTGRARLKVDRTMAARFVYDVYTTGLLTDLWHDTGPRQPGLARFDLGAAGTVIDGQFDKYRSDFPPSYLMGSRQGPQLMKLEALALQMLDAFPGLWTERYQKRFAEDLLVQFRERAPVLDGKPDPQYTAPISLGATQAAFTSSADSFYVLLRSPKQKSETLSLDMNADGQAEGSVTVMPDGVTAVKQAGERLRSEGKVVTDGSGWVAEVRLPYSVAKGQTRWANGVEHGRLRVKADNSERTLYLMSSESQLRAYLERDLVGGLRFWNGVLSRHGYVPSGWEPEMKHSWTQTSDTGGYAHLLSAASLYLMWHDGKRDWELAGK